MTFCAGVRGGPAVRRGDLFRSPILRVRPVGGSPARMRCGWRWPRMTRCCALRSRRTRASSSVNTGDGMAAAFTSPMSAVGAAVDAQSELELPVRMGLATGEAELRDGDYFGTVLNRAARVMAAGHGGQILVAHSTAGCDRCNVELVNLGPRRLRDLPESDHDLSARSAGVVPGCSALAGDRFQSRKSAGCGQQAHRSRRRCRRRRIGDAIASIGHIGGRRRRR